MLKELSIFLLIVFLFFSPSRSFLFVSFSSGSFFFQSIRIPPPYWVIIGPVTAVDSGHWACLAPHSTEVMCLPWRWPAAPGEQWLGAGITSGLSDAAGHSSQDKQKQVLEEQRRRLGRLFSPWSANLSPSCLRTGGKWPWQLYTAPHDATRALWLWREWGM